MFGDNHLVFHHLQLGHRGEEPLVVGCVVQLQTKYLSNGLDSAWGGVAHKIKYNTEALAKYSK